MSNEASQNNKYNKLIAILAKKFGLTGKEIADIFWLTLKRQEDSNSNVNIQKNNDTRFQEVEEESNPSQSQQDSNSKQNISTSSQSSLVSSKSTPKADIIPEKSTSSGKNLPLRVADAPSIRESLELMRSLKSFQTLRIDSGKGLILDDTKSAERTAAEGFLALVLKPELEALFELALVVDESKSMLIWRHTINELKTLLQGSGFFRDVRTWGLVTDENGKISFRPGIGKTANKQRSASHRELIDPEGRRLILVVSDCVAAIWRNGAVNSILKDWTKSQSVAIVQMLPDWLWLRTGLASGASVILGSLAPVMRNKSLLIKELLLWKDIDLDRGIKVPVFTLDPQVALNWSQMVAGKSDANTSGFVFPEELKVKSRSHSQKKPQNQSQNQSQNKSQNQKTNPDINPEKRVERFRMTASPMARKLAGLLAAAPVITLPVVRLIQENLLRESRQVHVAEVFLGGLLRPLDEIETDTNPDRVHYDFMHDEIRNILLAGPAQDSVNVLDIVSEYVAKNLGKSVKDFVAYLKEPETTDNQSDREQVKAFAEVTTQILKQLGGDYAAFARELEGESPESNENKAPDNQDTPRETEELLQIIEKAATERWTELDLSGRELTVLPPEIGQLTQLKKLILGKYELDEDGDILSFIGNEISALPAEIGLLTQLEELQIFANQLTNLPTEIAQLTNLQTLNLGSNQLSSIPAEIFQLTNLQELDLCGNELTVLPPQIGKLTQLKKLVLGKYEEDNGSIGDTIGNKISALPPEIGLLTQLEGLQIVGNQLSSLPAEIFQLTNLQKLDLCRNQLSSLSTEIGQLTNLQILRLDSNQLSSLPVEIGQLTNLQRLDLWENQLSSLPVEIGQLINLQKLYLNSNQLSSLPVEIGQLINLQKLYLWENQLSSLPVEIGQLTNLQGLRLNNNQLSSLPVEIGQLTNLQTLNLYKNQLSSLPTEIGQLTNLQDLRLSDNQLSSLPVGIGQLTNLQELYLYENQLSSLPTEIGQLTNLQTLYLWGNQLSSLPEEIWQLTNLQDFSLASSKLSSLPVGLFQFTNLQILYLSNNQLSNLPVEIGQLTNLQELHLNNNELSSLPVELFQFTNLQILYLSDNQLSSLPTEIGQLTNLQELHLDDNQLSSLPGSIRKLTKLEKLDLSGNPISIPRKILRRNAKEILDFYFRVQDFQILVDRNKNIRTSSEQGEVSAKLRLEMNDVELELEGIESNQTNNELLKTLGKKLYQALFPNDINAQFHETISSVQANQYGVVHLRLRFESPELAALPWEFLFYEENNTFLANDEKVVLSRYIDVPEQKRDIKAANQPLKILLVISTPTDLNPLDATGEENLIREALKKHIETDRIELDVLTEATTSNIRRKLDEKPYNVFHFIGHGVFKNNKSNIALVDEDGKAYLLNDENFANFFLGDHNLGLIVLNCCQGGTLSANQAFAGTVLNLVQHGIPAVVAMQYEISDSTAKLFADEFYSYLAQGESVDVAIQKTRNAISQEVGLDRRDFATPVIYMGAKGGKIFEFDDL